MTSRHHSCCLSYIEHEEARPDTPEDRPFGTVNAAELEERQWREIMDDWPSGDYQARLTGYLPYEYVKYTDNQMAHELSILVRWFVCSGIVDAAPQLTFVKLCKTLKTLFWNMDCPLWYVGNQVL